MLKIKDIKNTTLQIRLTEQEKETIKDAAAKKQLSISDYLKQCVNNDLKSNSKLKLNVEYGRVQSSIKCIAGIIEKLKDSESPANTTIPLVYPAVEELMKELEDLKAELQVRNLVD